MNILCPHCHAPESQCPGVIPACAARRAATQRLYAAVNGDELEVPRAENERLRAELAKRRGRR